MNFTQTQVFRIGSLAIALGLLAGPLPELGAQEAPGGLKCSLASLEGTYGAYRHGTAPYGPVAAVGIYFFDGAGGWNLVSNISRNGEISVDEYWEGGYSVNADCTGAIDEVTRIVIVDDGNGFYLLSLFEGGFTMYEVATRVHKFRGNWNEH